MKNYSKDIINEDGTKETIVITSNDDYTLNMTRNYRLANHQQKKESKFSKKFKNSLLGTDIGYKSSGFSHVAILATIIAIGALCVMYIIWKI